MSTASSIRTYLSGRGGNSLFTTREVLHCGSRHSVDQALHLMVKSGELVRWANGVFSLPSTNPPNPEEVARIKAISRGDSLTNPSYNPFSYRLAETGQSTTIFGTTGSTSSFRFGQLRIQLKHTGKRKLDISDRSWSKPTGRYFDRREQCSIAGAGTSSSLTDDLAPGMTKNTRMLDNV